MMPIDQFKDRVDHMIGKIKNSLKAKGTERICLPDGVRIKLKRLAEDMEMDVQKLFANA